MAKINHDRPQFKVQEIWVKYDSFLPPSQRPGYETHPTSPPRKKPGFLERHLRTYQGEEPRLVDVRDKYLRGEALPANESSWAAERFRFLERVAHCKANLLQRDDESTKRDLAVLNLPKLSYRELEAVERTLATSVGFSCGRHHDSLTTLVK